MAHVQVQFLNINIMGGMIDQPVSVDCWRATLIFLAAKTALATIDGVPWDFLTNPGDETRHVQRIEMGGCYKDGKPVNIKHDLRFNTANEPIQALLILQYFVDDGK